MLAVTSEILSDIPLLLPEIQLAISALFLQMLGVFSKKSQKIVGYLSIVSMLSILYYIYQNNATFLGHAFNHMYQSSPLSLFAKSIVLTTSSLALLLYIGMPNNLKYTGRSEFSVLMLLAVIGIFVMASAGHFLTLYLGLELQSLSLYLLTTFDRNNIKSSEAGLKYFVLGALASCVMLFGISLIYGFSGTLEFSVLKDLYSKQHFHLIPTPAVVVGAYMVIVGILFKLSVAPFHAWTPDVYEGAPVPTVAFLSSSSKLGSLVVLISLTMHVLKDCLFAYEMSIQILSVLTLAIGAIAAIQQTSLKRLLGYSTILNMGYVLLALAAKNTEAIQASLMYMVIYSFTMLGLFALLIVVLGEKIESATLDSLSGLASNHKLSSVLIAILLFSLIGIPPFAGFFGKFYVFQATIQAGLYGLTILGVLASVIAAYYYLKIIKIMYFDKGNVTQNEDTISLNIIFIAGLSILFTMIFIISPNIIPELTLNIAKYF
ncbi:MAG: NADH:ubiquinone oxidoreductase subunit 2 [Rickettsiaceae bacterium]|jgi:NADH-quinone oxidoreductase subunit N|nr:NADH:ubiquinone oxidoreductase subunit 2 [Rickettsiaceae bacterium]